MAPTTEPKVLSAIRTLSLKVLSIVSLFGGQLGPSLCAAQILGEARLDSAERRGVEEGDRSVHDRTSGILVDARADENAHVSGRCRRPEDEEALGDAETGVQTELCASASIKRPCARSHQC